MKLEWLMSFALYGALLLDGARASVCTQLISQTVSKTTYYNTNCGWWGWGRCQTSSVTYQTEYMSVPKCCVGSFGRPESGCIGECPYSTAQVSQACPYNGQCRDFKCVKSGFSVASPSASALTFNENDNEAQLLWTANATCFVQGSCNCTSEKFDSTGSCTCSAAVPCTQCTVQSTNNIAEVRNGREIWRKKCSNTKCKECSAYPGCLDHGVTYEVKVRCSTTGYNDNDQVTNTFKLTVKPAPEPNITISTGSNSSGSSYVDVVTDAAVGDTLLVIDPITIPESETNPVYVLKGPTSTRTGQPLFKYNSTTNAVTVNSDLSTEIPGVYNIQLCVVLRRGETCATFSINILQTTTTSTTTTTTTPEPEEEFFCFGIGIWRTIPGFDAWCEMICKSMPETCPYLHTHCECVDILLERSNCTSVVTLEMSGSDTYKRYLDAWCDLNCNYGEDTFCPDEHCTCQ